MDRRQYIQTALGATAGTMAVAGCLGSGGGGTATPEEYPNVKLPKPEMEFDSEDVRFPAWNQQIPSVTLPRALAGGEMTTTEFDKPLALTFVYTNCQTVCPLLTQALVAAQRSAAEGGWSDAVAFAEISFDPARDTPDRLRTYARERDVDLEAGNWTFLLPESEARAKATVQEEFGVHFEKTHPEDMEMYMFTHRSLILLVNADGYVERFWRGNDAAATAASELPDAMNRLRKA